MADNQFRGIEGQDCPAIRVTQNAGCPSIRVRITGGGETPEAPLSDVNFYDYDGKRVASYTAADFAALTEMPANPSHQGLTAQGWNWSLSDAQAYVAAYGILDIGQNYITDDGKTRLYISIPTPGRMSLSLNFSQTAANGVTVDWGDDSATETAAGTGNQTIPHTYAAPGEYVITLEVTSGTAKLNNSVFGPNANNSLVNMRALYKAEIGANMQFDNSAFAGTSIEEIALPNNVAITSYCFQNTLLRYITIPPGTYLAGVYSFSNAVALRRVSFSKSGTYLGDGSFAGCKSLRSSAISPTITEVKSLAFNGAEFMRRIIIPEGVTTLGNACFSGCPALSYLEIPSTVTSIGTNSFANCYGMAEYHFKGTTPPTITSSTFSNIPADCKIYVPASAVAAYQGATNWSTYASQIVGE